MKNHKGSCDLLHTNIEGKTRNKVRPETFNSRKFRFLAPLTVQARILNFLEFYVSGPTLFLIFLLYHGYVEIHVILDGFSWTDTLNSNMTSFKWRKHLYPTFSQHGPAMIFVRVCVSIIF